jgi:HlyD family secretion protein
MTARLTPLLPVLLVLAACSDTAAPLQGYVEGTYVYVSAEDGGRVVERHATAGARVAAGDVLFTLDDANQKQAVAGAEARLAEARAQLANLRTGQREEEISVLAANLASAQTTLHNADDDYHRKLLLLDKGVVSQSVVDTARDTAQAQADAAERTLEVARLPARPEEITAAEKNVTAEEASAAQAKIALERREIKAPATGLVEETFYEPGELVAAGQPVVSLLPDANRKVRFFLPERQLASVSPGKEIGIGCDGCATGLRATVDFVATAAEFTPPII